MRPLDPRLLRHARGAAVPIGVLGGLGVLTACLVIAQAWLLAGTIAGVFIDKSTLRPATLAALAAVTVARAAVTWASHATAHRASATVKTRLRSSLLAHVIALGPGWRRGTPGDATSGDATSGDATSGDATSGSTAPGSTAPGSTAPGSTAPGEPAARDAGSRDAGSRDAGSRDAAALTQLATTGLDGLDAYFTSYLPALILAAAVPLTVLATITVADPVSGITVLLTLPLVPLFGALIGMATSRHAQARWRALGTLAHHFHDVVSGLPTLRVFGRAEVQRSQIERVTREYRRATMATLRLAFLSSFALELVATMSVALVATEIGLRLAYGHLDLRTGLLVLILAPEAYLPLRNLGSQFHATADGLAAAEQVFAILETPALPSAPVPGTMSSPGAVPTAGTAPSARASHIRVDGVTVCHEGRADPAPDRATFTVAGGRLTVLTGPSGCGKSTMLCCLLGFTEPTAGAITPRPVPPSVPPPVTPRPDPPPITRNGPVVPADRTGSASTGPDLAAADAFPVRRALAAAWLPQQPVLFAGTVASNIRLGWPDAPGEAVAAAARDAALDDVRLDTILGERGTGLSAGQRRRVALARALLPAAPLLLLDEPTAGLDADREAAVIRTLRRRAGDGTAVLVVSHRPAVIAAADAVFDLGGPAGRAAAASPEALAPEMTTEVPA